MSEKGTRVSDALSGDVIATRDARETDENGLSRTVQLVDLSVREAIFLEMRGVGGLVTSADSYDLTSLSEDFKKGVRTVGDKRILAARLYSNSGSATASVTPLGLLDNYASYDQAVLSYTYDGYADAGGGYVNTPGPMLIGGDGAALEHKGFVGFNFSGISSYDITGNDIVRAILRLNPVTTYSNSDNKYLYIDHAKTDTATPSQSIIFDDTYFDGTSDLFPVARAGYPTPYQFFDITKTVRNLFDNYFPNGSNRFLFRISMYGTIEASTIVSYETIDGTYDPYLLMQYKYFNQDSELYKYYPFDPQTMAVGSFYDGSWYVSPVKYWDVLGAKQVGLHIATLTGNVAIRAALI